MGLMTSHHLSSAELQAHQDATGLSIEQLEQLHERFLALDRRQRGYLTPTELLRIPQLSQNPLHRQIINVFFWNTDRITFGQFVRTCATFLMPQFNHLPHQRADGRAQKLRLLSKIFDTQRCGLIERSNFRKVMMSLLDGEPPFEGATNVYPYSSEQELKLLEELAFGTYQSISYETFEQRLSTADIESKLAINKWLEADKEQQQEQQQQQLQRHKEQPRTLRGSATDPPSCSAMPRQR